jgi:predicted ATPase
VLERVERLRPEARRILDAAAVLAAPSDAATLRAVAELDFEDGGRGLAAALRGGLLQETEPDRYAFRHALDAEAVDGAIPPSERRTLHHRAGETLEKLDHPPVGRLARHFREGNDTEK